MRLRLGRAIIEVPQPILLSEHERQEFRRFDERGLAFLYGQPQHANLKKV